MSYPAMHPCRLACCGMAAGCQARVNVEKQRTPGVRGPLIGSQAEIQAVPARKPPANSDWWGLVRYWWGELIWRRRYWRLQHKRTGPAQDHRHQD
jgi:hypothetical protein